MMSDEPKRSDRPGAGKRAEEALRESEERYRTLFDQALDGICLADAETGLIIDCNQALLALVDRERAELIGQSQRILHPVTSGQEVFSPTFRQHLTEQEGHILETQVVTKTGIIRDVEIKANFLHLEGRKTLQGVFRDITERKRAEEALRESEHRLADIIDFLPDATFAVNLKGEVIAWNRALEELTGTPKEELLGKGNLAYAVPFYGKTGPMLIDRIFQDWKEIEKNYDYLTKREDRLIAEAFVPALRGGKGAYLWGIASPLYDSSGSIVGAIESLRDVSERKELEREAILRSRVLDTATDAVLVHDLEGHFLYVNEAACRMHGYPRAELLAIPLARLVTPEGASQISERTQQIVQWGELTFEVEHFTKFGSRVPIEVHASFQQFEGRQYILSMMRDIRERKQLEAEVEKAQTDFLFAVSHELKTPLLIMAATEEMVELLPAEQQVERFRGYTDVWKRNLIRLRTIIDNLVDSQRSPRTGMKLNPQPTNLGALVEHLLEELAPLAQKKGLQLQPEIDLYRLLSLDPEACVRILTNLLINAIKFSPASGEIRVQLREKADHAVLQIIDQGPGIPPDEIPHLFQPFRRGSVSVKTVVPGTGLGLYVCRILTEAQGGTISLESTVGQGTTVTVRFPLTGGFVASNL
jgi:PAS domain S-box-containing protein